MRFVTDSASLVAAIADMGIETILITKQTEPILLTETLTITINRSLVIQAPPLSQRLENSSWPEPVVVLQSALQETSSSSLPIHCQWHAAPVPMFRVEKGSRLVLQGVAIWGSDRNQAVDNWGELHLIECTVTHCSASGTPGFSSEGSGGAVFNWMSGTLLASSTHFDGNAAVYLGGALLNQGHAVLLNCALWNHSASVGGAIYNGLLGYCLQEETISKHVASLALEDCKISGCLATGGEGGGALYNAATCEMTVTRSTIRDNRAELTAYGGAIYNAVRIVCTRS